MLKYNSGLNLLVLYGKYFFLVFDLYFYGILNIVFIKIYDNNFI